MPESCANRQLLFGFLALQMDFIAPEELLTASREWLQDKSRPMQDILVAEGALSASDVDLLAPLVERHIENHAGDPQQSLAAISSIGSIAEDLRSLKDTEIDATLLKASERHPVETLDHAIVREVAIKPATTVGADSSGGTRFRIIRPHASGGLGEVSLAQDTELNREVALKEIQTQYAHDEDSQSRFLLEAEVTGRLEHPGIVPVYGLGRYADGRPFYAMRFIKGDSLREAADRFHAAGKDSHTGHRVSYESVEFRKLLGRFLDVCNAIEYAHSRGVLHRDLKPGNIMLGKYGETLVVDWGLAKIKDQDDDFGHDGEATLKPSSGSGNAPTQMGSTIGTPAYMPPEQAVGKLDELGPASDVYSLGATLYYLLTGRPPVTGEDLGSILTKATTGDFPHPRAIKHNIPKPLEAICLRAVATRPDDRYPRPQALAEDVERFLADEPVSAYADPITARVRRSMRKHPASVAALLMLLLGMAGVALVQFRANNVLATKNRELKVAQNLTAAARDRAQTRGDLAITAIDRFRSAVEENVDVKNRPDLTELRSTLLQAPKEFYVALQTELADTANTDEDVLARLAQAELKLAGLTRMIDSQDRAWEAYEAAQEKYEELLRRSPGNAEFRKKLADIHNSLGGMALQQKTLGAARSQFRKALSLHEELIREQPQSLENQITSARVRVNLSMAEAGQGNTESALEHLETGRAQLDDVIRRAPDNKDAQYALSRNLERQGAILSRGSQRHEEAIDCLDQALVLARELAEANPDDVDHQSSLIYVLRQLSSAHNSMRHAEQAETLARQALKLQRELANKHPTYSHIQLNLTESMSQVADLQLNRGEVSDSLETFQEVIALRRKLCEDHPTTTMYQDSLSRALLGSGVRLYNLGRKDEALQRFRDLVPVREKIVQLQPKDLNSLRELGGIHYNIGTIAGQVESDEEALEAFGTSLDIRRQLAARVPQDARLQNDVAYTLGNIATIHVGRKDYAEALLLVEQAEKMQRALVEDNEQTPAFKIDLARTLRNRGNLLTKLGRPNESTDVLADARGLLEPLVTIEDPIALHRRDLAATLMQSGVTAAEMNDVEAAEKWHAQAMIIFKSLHAQQPKSVDNIMGLALLHNNMASLYLSTDQNEKARQVATEALELLTGRENSDDTPDRSLGDALRASYYRRTQSLARLGRIEEARADWQSMLATKAFTPVDEADRLMESAILAAWAGDARSAVKHAEEVAQARDADPSLCYAIGEIFALAAECTDTAERNKDYVRKAVQWLEKAEQGGYFDASNIHHLKGRVFRAIQGDDQFQALSNRLSQR